jgi:hypothetical protein
MYGQMIASEFFVDLSDQQQELLAGGADFDSNNTDFTQATANVRKTSSSSPQGDSSSSTFQQNDISSSAQDLLSPTRVFPLGVTGLASRVIDTPVTSFISNTKRG